jgi:hypothetical protein
MGAVFEKAMISEHGGGDESLIDQAQFSDAR